MPECAPPLLKKTNGKKPRPRPYSVMILIVCAYLWRAADAKNTPTMVVNIKSIAMMFIHDIPSIIRAKSELIAAIAPRKQTKLRIRSPNGRASERKNFVIKHFSFFIRQHPILYRGESRTYDATVYSTA